MAAGLSTWGGRACVVGATNMRGEGEVARRQPASHGANSQAERGCSSERTLWARTGSTTGMQRKPSHHHTLRALLGNLLDLGQRVPKADVALNGDEAALVHIGPSWGVVAVWPIHPRQACKGARQAGSSGAPVAPGMPACACLPSTRAAAPRALHRRAPRRSSKAPAQRAAPHTTCVARAAQRRSLLGMYSTVWPGPAPRSTRLERLMTSRSFRVSLPLGKASTTQPAAE